MFFDFKSEKNYASPANIWFTVIGSKANRLLMQMSCPVSIWLLLKTRVNLDEAATATYCRGLWTWLELQWVFLQENIWQYFYLESEDWPFSNTTEQTLFFSWNLVYTVKENQHLALLPNSVSYLCYASTAMQPVGEGGHTEGMLLGTRVLPMCSCQAQLSQGVGHGPKCVPCGHKPFLVLSRERTTIFPTP